MTPDWMTEAACKGADPDWFHPPDGYPSLKEYGLAICKHCPVKQDCLEYALSFKLIEDHYGIFGGTTPIERHRIRTKRTHQRKQPGPKKQIITGLDDIGDNNEPHI
jgi:WhiB family transcriptional regulator, redox-sensing transcriptional regulator